MLRNGNKICIRRNDTKRLYVCLLIIYAKYKNVYMVVCIANVRFTDNLSLLQPLQRASKSVVPCLLTAAFVLEV